MKDELKQDYRAAVDILQSLQGVHQPRPMTGLDESIQQINRWRRRFEMASARDWYAAAKDASDKLRGALDILRSRSAYAIEDLARLSNSRIEPSASMICRDIEGLRGEFEELTIDFANKRLTVQTSNISFDYVELGSFEIHLNWKYIKDSSPYDVIAVQPNCPSSNDSVTHPHIQGDSLCEGEGADAIRRALDEGRVYDFFCIVDQVLRNYNPHSAYVQIDDWKGVNCDSCGDNVDSDEVVGCCKCETSLCLDCSTSCESCCDRYCSECISSCECCGQDVCKYCMKSCDDCGEEFCKSCLFEGTCDDCITQQNETSETMAQLKHRTLRFTPYAIAKLLYLRDIGPTEVGGFGISNANDLLLVEDIQLVEQICSVISVSSTTTVSPIFLTSKSTSDENRSSSHESGFTPIPVHHQLRVAPTKTLSSDASGESTGP